MFKVVSPFCLEWLADVALMFFRQGINAQTARRRSNLTPGRFPPDNPPEQRKHPDIQITVATK